MKSHLAVKLQELVSPPENLCHSKPPHLPSAFDQLPHHKRECTAHFKGWKEFIIRLRCDAVDTNTQSVFVAGKLLKRTRTRYVL